MSADAGGNELPDLGQEETRLLLRLGASLVSDLDLESVLARVAEAACQVVHAETLAVPMIAPDWRTFTYRAASGELAAMMEGQTFPIDEGACGWVIRHQRPLLFGEGDGFAMEPEARWEPGMASALLVPLICRGAISGGLSAMGKRGGGAFTAHDLAVLTLFANMASIAVDNARLFEKARIEEARLRLVLDSAGEAIYGIDQDGICTFANPACLAMLGYEREGDLIGQPLHAMIHHSRPDGTPLPREECYLHTLVLQGRPSHSESESYWRRDGTAFPVEHWARPMLQDGRVVGAVVAFHDITARKAMESELRRSNAELEQFAYVASHDLQTPLRNIVSYSQLLERRYKGRLDDDADDFIGFIIGSSKQMSHLISDLLQYSRVSGQSKVLGSVSAAAAIGEAISVLKDAIEAAGAEITVGPLPMVTAEYSLLVSLFQNLLGNALKYRAPDRRLRIGVTARLQAPGTWRFAVADNGIGIEPQYFDKIFEIFQRLHPAAETEGTGLGLTLCRRIAHRFGGTIWVESSPGSGATFFFTLKAGSPSSGGGEVPRGEFLSA